MEQKTIILSADLSERRSQLEAELSAVVSAQVEGYLQRNLKSLLNRAGFTEGTAEVEWEFHGEYDDEGGTDYWPSCYSLTVNGEDVDIDEYDEEDEDSIYLRDYLADILCSYHSDLYEEYITEVTVKLD